MAVSNEEINAWLQANAGASDATIAAAMDEYKVTPAQMAQATGLDLGAVQSRYDAALPTPAAAPLSMQGLADTSAPTAPLYTGLTAQSNPQQIASAYSQFADSAGGDTQAVQTQAVDYLKKLGVSDEYIQNAYQQYQSPLPSVATPPQGLTGEVDPYVYAYEYGVANNDFSGLRGLLQQTPDSTQLVSKYNLTPEQINQIEFGTGFDLDQSGGYGAGTVGNDWDYNKYLDELREGNTDNALSMYRSADPLGAQRLEKMYQELQQQQTVTGDSWAAGNLGSKDAAAMDFALRLMENGLDSIYDLGQRTVEVDYG